MGVCGRLGGADVSTSVACRVRIIVIDVRAVAVLAGVLRHIAAVGGAFVPVVGVVRAPIRCPAVGMTRPLGIQRDVPRHGRVKVILVPIRAVLVRIPAAKGVAGALGRAVECRCGLTQIGAVCLIGEDLLAVYAVSIGNGRRLGKENHVILCIDDRIEAVAGCKLAAIVSVVVAGHRCGALGAMDLDGRFICQTVLTYSNAIVFGKIDPVNHWCAGNGQRFDLIHVDGPAVAVAFSVGCGGGISIGDGAAGDGHIDRVGHQADGIRPGRGSGGDLTATDVQGAFAVRNVDSSRTVIVRHRTATNVHHTAVNSDGRIAFFGDGKCCITGDGNFASCFDFNSSTLGTHSAAENVDRTVGKDGFGIAADFAAVHIEESTGIHLDRSFIIVGAALHRATVEVQGTAVLDGVAAAALGDKTTLILRAVTDVQCSTCLNLDRAPAPTGLGVYLMTVEAQINRAGDIQISVHQNIVRQIIAARAGDLAKRADAGPRHIRMARVVAHSSIAAADAMGVRRCRVRRRGDRTGDGRGFADAVFGQLDRHREAAVRAALIGIAARYCRNHITNGNLAVAGGNVALPDFSGCPCGKRDLCVRLRHGDRKALRQRVDQLVDLRRNADMGEHTIVSVIVLRCKLPHAFEFIADSLVELLRICAGKYYFGNAVQHRTTVFIAVLCVEDCLRRQKRNCVTIRKARRILCTHSQADVAVECKRSHINPIF